MHTRADAGIGVQVPRPIALLNDAAKSAGVCVSVSCIQVAEWNPGLLVVQWAGAIADFQKLQLMPRSWRFPLCAGALRIPHCAWSRTSHFLAGRVSVEGDKFTFIAREKLPFGIRHDGPLEISDYGDEIAYFGSRDALISAGVCSAAQFPAERRQAIAARQGFGEQFVREWETRLHPSGHFLHTMESEGHARAREPEQNAEWERHSRDVERWRQQAMQLRKIAIPARIDPQALAHARADDSFQSVLRALLTPKGRQK